MIVTDTFELRAMDDVCLERILMLVNDYIKKNRIRREDIIEYRTERKERTDRFHHEYLVTISWWKE